MITLAYKKQVALLLQVLPEVAKHENFALHGGTAINLFVRNLPRLSVDIDLTYLPIENRETSLRGIDKGLRQIMAFIESAIPNVLLNYQQSASKLQVSAQGAQIKVEVNQINRGVLKEPQKMELCPIVQETYDAFCAISVVEYGQLWGGKICAALDRQHPRDLFDAQFLLKNRTFSRELIPGLLLSLLSSVRPLHELLKPNMIDQKQVLENQFRGMTNEPFSYDDFEETRTQLINALHHLLDKKEKAFLIGFMQLNPDWSDFNFRNFPSIQWKLQNLSTLKQQNPNKFNIMLEQLHEALE